MQAPRANPVEILDPVKRFAVGAAFVPFAQLEAVFGHMPTTGLGSGTHIDRLFRHRLPVRLKAGITIRLMVVIVDKDAHRSLAIPVLPRPLAINENITITELKLLTRQPDDPLDVRFRRLGGIAEDDDLPPLRRAIQIRLFVDQQLVAVIARHLAQVDRPLSAVGTNGSRPTPREFLRFRLVIGVVGDSKWKRLPARRAFDPLVEPQQTGRHRTG